jgi:hypothetical protein
MSDQYYINGNQYGWASIVLKFAGDVFTGFRSISYGDKRERSYAYGMGRPGQPRGRTAGKYTPDEIKLGGFKGSAQILLDTLAASASDQRSYGNVEIEITVQYLETSSGANEVPILVEMHNCVVTGVASSEEEGPDALADEITLSTMGIVRNGTTLYDGTLQ